MVYPATDLPIRLRICPEADPNLAPGSWPNWTEITEDIRLGQNDRIEITEGRGSYDSDVDTSVMDLTLDNRQHADGRVAGRYIAGNPLSPYRLSRNTPIMASVLVAQDSFSRTAATGVGALETPGDNGVSWSPQGSATLWSVGSGKLTSTLATANLLNRLTLAGGDMYDSYGRATFSTSAVSLGGDMVAAIRMRYVSNDNYYFLRLNFEPALVMGSLTGLTSLQVQRMRDGVFSTIGSVDLDLPYAAGQGITFAWQVVGASISLKAWYATDPEPDAWQLAVQDTEVIEGAPFHVEFWRTSGNTNPGSLSMTMDDFVVESPEFAGFVRNWPARWDTRGLNAYVPIHCTGILGRVRQQDRGTKIVQSPLYRQLSSYPAAAYLPLEDESGAVRPANVQQRGVGGYFDDMTVGVSSDLPGSARVVQFASDTSRLRVYPWQGMSKGAGFSCMWLMKFDSLPSAAVDLVVIATDTPTSADRWVVRFDGSTINLRAFRDSDGAGMAGPFPIFYGIDPTKWFACELRIQVTGTVAAFTLRWTQVGTNGYYTISNSYDPTPVPRVTSVAFNSASAVTGAQFAHVWVGPNTLPFFSQTFVNVWAGYPGETAGARFKRILSEAAIPGYVEPGADEEQGPQEIDSSLTILKSAQDAEHGIMFESGWGLALRPRSNRYQRPVTLTLDAQDGYLATPPQGDYDDRWIVNDATGSAPRGAQGYRYSDEEHVAREGRYPKPYTWNLAQDSRLLDHLAWEVYLGTRPGYSWPRISLDFKRNPEMISAWRGRAFGARVQVTNAPVQLAGQPIDVIVEGTTTTWGPAGEWRVEANCSPAAPWEVPVIGDAEMVIDSAESELFTGIDENDMSMTVWVRDGRDWSTDPADYPLNVMIFVPGEATGEEVTVSAVSGTEFQLFTLSARAVNGVSMSHVGGSRVGLAAPVYVAL